uniref:Small ribosomal subunit protein mS29 n=1 Tax=Hordeum vulgare subsp. vulgare TaxID=112509 RepID=F2DZU6_HORVV|nr:predicted protein [Hordeum vulgare subsp. vulgare]
MYTLAVISRRQAQHLAPLQRLHMHRSFHLLSQHVFPNTSKLASRIGSAGTALYAKQPLNFQLRNFAAESEEEAAIPGAEMDKKQRKKDEVLDSTFARKGRKEAEFVNKKLKLRQEKISQKVAEEAAVLGDASLNVDSVLNLKKQREKEQTRKKHQRSDELDPLAPSIDLDDLTLPTTPSEVDSSTRAAIELATPTDLPADSFPGATGAGDMTVSERAASARRRVSAAAASRLSSSLGGSSSSSSKGRGGKRGVAEQKEQDTYQALLAEWRRVLRQHPALRAQLSLVQSEQSVWVQAKQALQEAESPEVLAARAALYPSSHLQLLLEHFVAQPTRASELSGEARVEHYRQVHEATQKLTPPERALLLREIQKAQHLSDQAAASASAPSSTKKVRPAVSSAYPIPGHSSPQSTAPQRSDQLKPHYPIEPKLMTALEKLRTAIRARTFASEDGQSKPAEGTVARTIADRTEAEAREALRALSEAAATAKAAASVGPGNTKGISSISTALNPNEDFKIADLDDDSEDWFEQYLPPPAPVSERAQTDPLLYVDQPLVRFHTEADMFRYFPVSPDVLTKIGPEMNKPLNDEFKHAGNFLMIRPPAFNIVQKLKTVTKGDAGLLLSAHGERGCGKSATLHYAMQYAIQEKWLLVAVRGDHIMNDTLGLITRNKQDPSVWDQPRWTAKFFTELVQSQGDRLKQISLQRAETKEFYIRAETHRRQHFIEMRAAEEKLAVQAAQLEEMNLQLAQAAQARKAGQAESEASGKKKDKKDKRDKEREKAREDKAAKTKADAMEAAVSGGVSSGGAGADGRAQLASHEQDTALDAPFLENPSLYDVVMASMHSDELMPEVLSHFMREIKITQDVPVLVVIDSINAWDHDSPFLDPETEFRHIPARQLGLIKELDFFASHPPRYGGTLFAFSQQYTKKNIAQYKSKGRHMVSHYDQGEVARALSHYKHSNLFIGQLDEANALRNVARVLALSGGTPREVYKVAGIFS